MPQPTAINPEERAEAENAARELLRDLIGPDYSDTTLRVCADHLLSFRRHPKTHAEQPPIAGLDRLFAIAKSDTGQSARVANFLLAWWNGTDLGHSRSQTCSDSTDRSPTTSPASFDTSGVTRGRSTPTASAIAAK